MTIPNTPTTYLSKVPSKDIAVEALFTEFSSLLGKSTFHPVSKKTLVA